MSEPKEEVPEHITAAQKLLTEYYKQPVMPVQTYCDKLWAWLGALEQNCKDEEWTKAGSWYGGGLVPIVEAASSLRLAIMKSAALGRMIYGGEDLRTRKCPEHKGHWQGLAPFWNGGCAHGCDWTGWLPNKTDEEIKTMMDERRSNALEKFKASLKESTIRNEWTVAEAKSFGMTIEEIEAL